jgi:ribosome maturation protein Sdo1
MYPKAKLQSMATLIKPLVKQKSTRLSRKYVSSFFLPLTLPTFSNYYQILQKGEVQVGEKVREHDLTSIRKEIATLVAEKCVDPATQKPYPVGMIEKAMSEAGYSVKPGKNAKSQVTECIKLLQSDSKLPIQRARMRIRVTMPNADGERLREKVLGGAEKVEKDEVTAGNWEIVITFLLLVIGWDTDRLIVCDRSC